MFKKPFQTRGRTVLRESDKRRLRQDVIKHLPTLGDPAHAAAVEAALAELIPSKRTDVEVLKVTTHHGINVKVYTTAGEPVLVELDKPTPTLRFFPTVYTLTRLPPAALPPLLTFGQLLPVLQRGADLMMPGVVLPPGGAAALSAQEGEVRALWARGFATPVGVGTMAAGSSSAAFRERQGKALLMLHVHGDRLWQLGSKTPLPPAAAAATPVPPPYTAAADDAELDNDADLAALAAADDDGGEAAVAAALGDVTLEAPADADGSWEDQAGGDDDDAGDAEDNEGAGAAPAPEPVAEAAEPTASEVDGRAAAAGDAGAPAEADVSMDELLEAALLLALRRTVKDKDLPMLASTFYAQHMQPLKPRGLAIDIKQSNHKKLGKFLAAVEKDGLIKTKEAKGVISITAVNRTHERYTRFRPAAWQPAASDDGTEGAAAPAAAAPAAAAAAANTSREIQVQELYRPTGTFVEMFEAAGFKRSDYCTFAQVRTALYDYIARNKLADTENPRLVVLDPFLAEHLVPKNDRANVFKAPRDGLATTLAEKCHQFYRVTIPGVEEPILRKGSPRSIELSVEQRGGHKSVTRVVGLETFALDPDKFAQDMRKKLACSTTVSPLPGKQATGMEVLLQGSMTAELAEYLHTSCGVPRKFIHVKEKPGKK